MKFTVEKTDIARALSSVERIVDRRSSLPILQNVQLDVSGDLVSVTATDLDMIASHAASADVTQPGSITAQAGVLNDLVAKLPDGSQVSLELDAKSQLIVRAGRALHAADAPRD